VLPNSRPIRTLFIIPDLSGGGSEKVLLTLLQALDRSRFIPTLVMTRGGGSLANQLPSDIVVCNLGASRSRYALIRLARILWRLRPDAIVSMALHLTVLLAVLRPILPRGIRYFARQNIHPTAYVRDDRFRYWRQMMCLMLPRMDRIICQTDEMLDDLANNFGIDPRLLIRIYNPVDRDALHAAAKGPSPYRGPGPHLVSAGRLDHQKGFDVLLQAMNILKRRSIAVEVTILGEGEEESKLRQMAIDLDIGSSVHFPGFQSNPYIYFKNADAFVLSSRYEGLSNAMLEAICLGTPMIAVDVPGGVREALRGSNAAWIAPRHNAEDLANAIAECIRELPRVRASGICHPMIGQMERWKILQCYEEVLSRCHCA